MPTYILLSTLTPEGRQTLHKDPDRMEQVNKEIADFGCKVISQYAVLGQYDFVLLSEMPDAKAAAMISLVATGAGGTEGMTTSQAFTTAEAKDIFASAGKFAGSFKPMGAS